MKKLVSAVLAGSMLFSTNVLAQNTEEDKTQSVTDTQIIKLYKADDVDNEAMYQLQKYEIIEGDPNGDMRPLDFITRAEMTKIICKMLSLKITEYQQTEFEDVSSDDWFFGYVMAAAENEIVTGDGEGNFKPEENIKFDEVIKMVVSAMGYAPSAEAVGGFPHGYAMCASRCGILNDIDHPLGAECRRNTVFKMLSNALDVPFMVKTGFGDEEEYAIADGSVNGVGYVTFRTRITGNYNIPVYD